MVGAYVALLALLGVERLYELRLSRRNADAAFARGGYEVGREHFFWMRVLHVGFFFGCLLEVVVLKRVFDPAVGVPMLGLALAAQGLRYWAIRTLGESWNVRVIVVPGEPVVTTGPYRYLRHPNYLAVILEGVAVPMVHGAWITAAAFTVLNALLLAVRIRSEEAALERTGAYSARLGDRRRLLPTEAAVRAMAS